MKNLSSKEKIQKATKFLLASTGVVFFAYVFLLGNTIFDVVSRKVAENDSRELLAEISSLELSALNLDNSLSLDQAKELGFVESTPHFASRSLFVVR